MSLFQPSIQPPQKSNTWASSHGLPDSLLIDMEDGKHIGVVNTKQYVDKATDYFVDFYEQPGIKKLERSKYRIDMKKKVIEQLKYVIEGKSMDQGLNVLGVWMQRDVLFPQILEAHQQPAKKPDMVEIYNYIHQRRRYE